MLQNHTSNTGRRLAHHFYSHFQVLDEIVQLLTEDGFMGKMVVVLAGYEAEVNGGKLYKTLCCLMGSSLFPHKFMLHLVIW